MKPLCLSILRSGIWVKICKEYWNIKQGRGSVLKRDVVATIVYEVMPNPSDH
ncbi:hypothetical protein GIB67_018538, partial [Kingdonia uniflora]